LARVGLFVGDSRYCYPRLDVIRPFGLPYNCGPLLTTTPWGARYALKKAREDKVRFRSKCFAVP
jgi:hypothetical protein